MRSMHVSGGLPSAGRSVSTSSSMSFRRSLWPSSTPKPVLEPVPPWALLRRHYVFSRTSSGGKHGSASVPPVLAGPEERDRLDPFLPGASPSCRHNALWGAGPFLRGSGPVVRARAVPLRDCRRFEVRAGRAPGRERKPGGIACFLMGRRRGKETSPFSLGALVRDGGHGFRTRGSRREPEGAVFGKEGGVRKEASREPTATRSVTRCHCIVMRDKLARSVLPYIDRKAAKSPREHDRARPSARPHRADRSEPRRRGGHRTLRGVGHRSGVRLPPRRVRDQTRGVRLHPRGLHRHPVVGTAAVVVWTVAETGGTATAAGEAVAAVGGATAAGLSRFRGWGSRRHRGRPALV